MSTGFNLRKLRRVLWATSATNELVFVTIIPKLEQTTIRTGYHCTPSKLLSRVFIYRGYFFQIFKIKLQEIIIEDAKDNIFLWCSMPFEQASNISFVFHWSGFQRYSSRSDQLVLHHSDVCTNFIPKRFKTGTCAKMAGRDFCWISYKMFSINKEIESNDYEYTLIVVKHTIISNTIQCLFERFAP